MKQEMLIKIALVLAIVIIIAGGGYWVFTNRSVSVEQVDVVQEDLDLDNQVPVPAPGMGTAEPSNPPVSETEVVDGNWVTTTNQQLDISFEHPSDATVSPVVKRETADGTTISELIVTPAGGDVTRVHFFSTDATLDQARDIQIYGSTSIGSSEFVDVTIDGAPATRRIDHYLNNDCTNELTVVEKSGTVYGFHVVQCPTHSESYDQLIIDIINSLRLL